MKRNKCIIIKGKGLTSLPMVRIYEDSVSEYGQKHTQLWTLNEDIYKLSQIYQMKVDTVFDVHKTHELAFDLPDTTTRYIHWDREKRRRNDKHLPLDSILKSTGCPKYFTCTVAYMIALAACRPSTDKIVLIGCDFIGCERERTFEQHCVDFWLGWAIGNGVKINHPFWVRIRKEEIYE